MITDVKIRARAVVAAIQSALTSGQAVLLTRQNFLDLGTKVVVNRYIKRDGSMTSVDQQKEEYFWNGIAFLIFVALCVISVVHFGIRHCRIESFGSLDLSVLGFATFRVIHLVGTRLKIADQGWRRMLCELLACIWCTGMWSGLMLVTMYILGLDLCFAVPQCAGENRLSCGLPSSSGSGPGTPVTETATSASANFSAPAAMAELQRSEVNRLGPILKAAAAK